MPLITPRRDTEQLTCETSSRYPRAAASSAPRNASTKLPLSSWCTCGVYTQAPSMPSESTAESISARLPPWREPSRPPAITRRYPGLRAAKPKNSGDYDDLLGLLSPVALRDLELDPLALFEGAVPVRLDR